MEDDLVKELDEAFIKLHKYLTKKSKSLSDFEEIAGPIVDAIEDLHSKNKSRKTVKVASTLLLGLLLSYTIFEIKYIYKLLFVICRLLLLQVLPWYDWTRIYYSDCILTNPFYTKRSANIEDCKVCESAFSVATFERLPPSVVWEELLPGDAPFKVIDAMDSWPVMNEDNFWFANVTDLYSSKHLVNLEPCDLTTNVKIPLNDLQMFFQIVHKREVESWFVHWENCDRKAAKALRYLYRRPYFLPRIVDIWESNWVIMSSNYYSRYYQQLSFNTDLLIVAQLRGWNKFRLIPKDPCDYICEPMAGVLAEGQILVVTSLIWDLEYKPGEGTDNFAIAVGGFWN